MDAERPSPLVRKVRGAPMRKGPSDGFLERRGGVVTPSTGDSEMGDFPDTNDPDRDGASGSDDEQLGHCQPRGDVPSAPCTPRAVAAQRKPFAVSKVTERMMEPETEFGMDFPLDPDIDSWSVAEALTRSSASNRGSKSSTTHLRVCSQSAADEVKYPSVAARFFGELGPHRLRWAHACNSRANLNSALRGTAHLIEADVSSGHFVAPEEDALSGWAALGEEDPLEAAVKVRSLDGEPVLMAHAPLQTESDLPFEDFIEEVMRHNDRAAAAEAAWAQLTFGHEAGHSTSQPTGPISTNDAANGEDEAAAFAQLLSSELETYLDAGDGGSSFWPFSSSCSGARRGDLGGNRCGPNLATMPFSAQRGNAADAMVAEWKMTAPRRKGVKLDFKQIECVGPALKYLADRDAVRRLNGHVWLNADVFEGPGALISAMDPEHFMDLCAQELPGAVLSLSWGSSAISAVREYTAEMVDAMITLCRAPVKPVDLSEFAATFGGEGAGPSSCVDFAPGTDLITAIEPYQVKSEVCLPAASSSSTAAVAPAHAERTVPRYQRFAHITFAVSVDYALGSAEELRRLMDNVPGSSLTVFSGFGGFSVTPTHVQDLLSAFSQHPLFFDVKLCSEGSCCSVQ